MGLADARESLSETTWKWRCKLLPHKEKAGRDIEDIEGSLSDEDPKKGPAKDPTFGIDATVKTLYEGKDSCNGYYDWVDYPPKQISKKAAAQAQRPAIMVYKIKDLAKPVVGGRFSLTYHQMTVQNPALVAALEPILKKEDMHLDVTDTVTFTSPFRPLFFCYEEILDLYKTTGDASLKGYLQILVQTLDSMLGETRERKRRLQASGLINFQLAWTYFPKNTIVYSYTRNAEMLCKVKDTSYEQTPCGMVLLIECQVLAFNGDAFVWVDRTLVIRQFTGNKPITDLDHYPLQFHHDEPAVQERLLERGKRVLDLQGLVYCSYNGIAVTDKQKHNVQGRILIDVVGYNKHERAQGKREGSDPHTEKNRATVTHADPPADAEKQEDAKDGKDGSKSQRHLSEARQLQNKEQMLARPDDLVFLSPLIEGYALKNKRWLNFYVEDIEPMVWNDKAYEHLVYDEQQKDLVLSFVEHHGHSKGHAVEDVIVGKGQGLIILLSGPPGTGKTLTAEAVADKTHRPLFYLQAEDLGTNPASLGANIKHIFEMATEWDAVILLDEADVFMAERNPVDITRNELVSIFLRELEYFRGIIFLTTNLYDTIDSAFRSRVSLHLLFKPLTSDARALIWRKFLGRLPRREGEDVGELLCDEDVEELSQWSLNGREIKNAVKMVRTWCDHKDYEMNLARLENGIRVTSPHASKVVNVDDDDELYN
ncbi:Vacuolar protein sorting-associated protein 4B [Colletotrichum plurivorum]|uniref:Vacuolar protein sorting-associated protein 4B n=1 Tax=Colletotrichum plurivorum TaxID=2175906 RepID=A0A8H6NE76_9PEZI|nr:Vacuolar protein sorting-associated protein 4B [Colletotrichum plurivorum]